VTYFFSSTLVLSLSLCLSATAQSTASPQSSAPQPIQQSVTVTTMVEPLPLAEGNRSVNVIDTQSPNGQPLLFNNITDFLRQDTSLNLQSRAGNGVQADLSLRGTTYEQTLVLVNGLRVNDPETGHLNLDIPLPLEAISRIDILHGSGSTFYGSDAIGGAVNLITQRPQSPGGPSLSLIAKSGFGNYGSEEQHLRADYAAPRWAEQLTGSRDTSDGFIVDRGYHSNALASETWLDLAPNYTTDILLAASDRPYGANQFYGPYDSWERTKGWFASIQQQLGPSSVGSFGYRRHSDLFILLLDDPSYYANNHITSSWEGALRRSSELGSNVSLSYGLEADGDSIHSSSLGRHARNQGAGYVNLALRSLGRFSLSIGGREEVFSGGDQTFSPSVAAAYTLTHTIRLRASASHGFRLPTYVDLYYADPSTVGNPNLKPESGWSYEAGLDWTPANGRLTLTSAVFRLQQKDTIDYSKFDISAPWQATNVQNLNLTGAETGLRLRLTSNQQLQFGYTAIRATQPPPGLISEYAFNFAAQSALAAWTAQLPAQITLRTQLAVVQKTTRTAYPLWDVSLARNTGRVRPYLRLLNLSNTGYQEIPDVPMQGRTIMGGAEFNWSTRH
jgi:outer membrane cobalamin receptor